MHFFIVRVTKHLPKEVMECLILGDILKSPGHCLFCGATRLQVRSTYFFYVIGKMVKGTNKDDIEVLLMQTKREDKLLQSLQIPFFFFYTQKIV